MSATSSTMTPMTLQLLDMMWMVMSAEDPLARQQAISTALPMFVGTAQQSGALPPLPNLPPIGGNAPSNLTHGVATPTAQQPGVKAGDARASNSSHVAVPMADTRPLEAEEQARMAAQATLFQQQQHQHHHYQLF